MAKELVDLFSGCGVAVSYKYVCALLARCPQTTRKRYIRFSDAWTWWTANPNFQPFSRPLRSSRRARRSARA